MEKYYTPDIEEFKWDFEFEWFNLNEWHKGKIYGRWAYTSWTELFEYLDEGRIRVKYLDEEDILELGFSLYWQDESEFCYKLKDISITFDFKVNRRILVKQERNAIWLTIKNKSELKQILKMICN